VLIRNYVKEVDKDAKDAKDIKQRRLPINTIFKFVPQQEAWVVERFGRFHRILEPGFAILIPIIDKISYVQTLKELATEIPSQSAITQDNVTISMDGVLYYRVIDPYKASYGVENPSYAITQLAQTTMRSEIGRLTLDKTLAERGQLNANIVFAINEASAQWGIKCLRYEIRDIQPPETVVKSMHSQVSAERQKRANILDSEGVRQSAINIAEGERQATILKSEALRAEKINKAQGEAEAILVKARASAESITLIAEAIARNGNSAVSLTVAEKYIEAFSQLAQNSTTLILPAEVGNPINAITQAMAIWKQVGSTLPPSKEKHQEKHQEKENY